ncbi:cytochrome P450 71A1 [Selaginella moellendorffii]|nr:cytochrome P450 71A1 [Selaginella moellendorffii]|eukprot:XP_002970158.2 cytochrome P450 71A1 [Selaginella moellendorffii]
MVMEQVCTKPQLPPQLPPSPTGLPFIGHLHLLGKLPHQSLLKLAQQYGDVMFLKLGKVNTLVVSSSDSAKEVLNTQDHIFGSRPKTTFSETIGYGGAGLAFANGENWKSTRKVCMYEVLTTKRVESFHPIRKFEVSLFMNELLKASREGSVVDLSSKLSDLTFNVISTMVLGKSYSASALSEAEKKETMFFKETLDEAAIMAGFHAGDYLPIPDWMDTQVNKIKQLQRDLDQFIQKEVESHRQRRDPGQAPRDFVDVLLSNSHISDTSIKALVVDMVGGGTESSAVSVVWALAELIKNPRLMERAQRELKEVVGEDRSLEESDIPNLPFLQAIVKETMRLHPPGPLLIPHESTEECEIGGYTVPARTRTVVNIYAIARDEDNWEDPLNFDPDRFMGSNIDLKGRHFEYLPFGSGRRICPGLMLAMATVQFILGSVLHGFNWRLPGGQTIDDLDMSESFGLTVPKAVPLKLVPSPRLEPQIYVKSLSP